MIRLVFLVRVLLLSYSVKDVLTIDDGRLENPFTVCFLFLFFVCIVLLFACCFLIIIFLLQEIRFDPSSIIRENWICWDVSNRTMCLEPSVCVFLLFQNFLRKFDLVIEQRHPLLRVLSPCWRWRRLNEEQANSENRFFNWPSSLRSLLSVVAKTIVKTKHLRELLLFSTLPFPHDERRG